MKKHIYKTQLIWTGNTGRGTASYRAYQRDYTIQIEGKPEIKGSSDPAFRGDKNRHNPEELFVASLSSCHMLWYLHLCAENEITVIDYEDKAEGVMTEKESGAGYFESVILKPKVTILEADKKELAQRLHHQANEMCFIANSCNFEISHEPVSKVLKNPLRRGYDYPEADRGG